MKGKKFTYDHTTAKEAQAFAKRMQGVGMKSVTRQGKKVTFTDPRAKLFK